ncbi:MAG: tRNA (adenosine(37)-N6)-dimethylallyltransferase MiaA [Saprospiraceae bacterium]|nr:tRNA (adenosine(37)-N6)-dimethylallyltransferase MiaA [Saprospiraceae bacterium]
MQRQKQLIVIGGATATGKTATAIEVAKHFGAEILSADSRQFYREMSIGTAKPTPDELAEVPHHFVNSISIQEEYSVGDFEKQALQLLAELYKKADVAVLVGGSGLFIRALCDGLDEFPEVPIETVKSLEEKLKDQGVESLQSELLHLDPEYHGQVDLQNPHRLIRALSVCRASGEPFSNFRRNEKKQRFFTPIYVLLELDRPALYERINNRVNLMIASGLEEEARTLYNYRHLNSLQTVGYQELFEYFEGKSNFDEAVEKIKMNSRRYAKRQSTWFRKDDHWTSFQPSEISAITSYLNQYLR